MQEPQWDVKCKIEEMKLSDFVKTTESENYSVWRYFDYKYMNLWFDTETNFLKSIDWRRFGFDKNGFDSTLWIGSRRAHTNCHQDSYGCNLVAQIHGRSVPKAKSPKTMHKYKYHSIFDHLRKIDSVKKCSQYLIKPIVFNFLGFFTKLQTIDNFYP